MTFRMASVPQRISKGHFSASYSYGGLRQAEGIRIEIVCTLNEREIRQKRLKRLPVTHMDLYAAAGFFFKFVKGRFEAAGAKRHARQLVAVQEASQLIGVNKRSANHFKAAAWCPAAFGEICAFDEAKLSPG